MCSPGAVSLESSVESLMCELSSDSETGRSSVACTEPVESVAANGGSESRRDNEKDDELKTGVEVLVEDDEVFGEGWTEGERGIDDDDWGDEGALLVEKRGDVLRWRISTVGVWDSARRSGKGGKPVEEAKAGEPRMGDNEFAAAWLGGWWRFGSATVGAMMARIEGGRSRTSSVSMSKSGSRRPSATRLQ